ncbi:adenine-specific methyltransferase EcoRI family protein [Brevundimonas intermedia]|uniref:adenine-specific methyltransferase EcoRI family protein n=1 Tax=Brevundimonas intermedia TaxID=74315 RepID=UPI00320AA972
MTPDIASSVKVSGNGDLNNAFILKKDEFYTRYEDVEKEVLHYRSYLEGKTVLCNCDDPFESAFFRFFVANFAKLKLAKLVSSCRAEPSFLSSGGNGRAYKAVVTAVPWGFPVSYNSSSEIEALFTMPGNSLSPLAGSGDFRSAECEALLEEADVVATNPPFSLFRDYIRQLDKHGKKFIVLGNMNAVTTREIFPLFRDNRVWYGKSIRSGDRSFHVPDSYPLNAAGCGIDENGRRFIRVKGVRWFTNIDVSGRTERLELTRFYRAEEYPAYENYDAIDVARTKNIPVDYDGLMGVPITFLDKYNPDQFDIVMLANGNARSSVPATTLKEVRYRPHPDDKGGVGIIDGRRAYARIIVRRKQT